MDLPTIEANIETGHYKSVAVFDSHFNSFFSSITKTYGRTSAMGIVALQLKKVFKFYFVHPVFFFHLYLHKKFQIYNNAKLDFAEQLVEILGPEEPLPPGFLQKRKQGSIFVKYLTISYSNYH